MITEEQNLILAAWQRLTDVLLDPVARLRERILMRPAAMKPQTPSYLEQSEVHFQKSFGLIHYGEKAVDHLHQAAFLAIAAINADRSDDYDGAATAQWLKCLHMLPHDKRMPTIVAGLEQAHEGSAIYAAACAAYEHYQEHFGAPTQTWPYRRQPAHEGARPSP